MFLLSPKGRAGRLEFALVVAAFVATGVLRFFTAPGLTSAPAIWAGVAFDLASMWVLVAAGVRRAHDLGKSGWILLLWIVPMVGVVLGVRLFFRPGAPGAERFGPPRGRPAPAPAQDLAA